MTDLPENIIASAVRGIRRQDPVLQEAAKIGNELEALFADVPGKVRAENMRHQQSRDSAEWER